DLNVELVNPFTRKIAQKWQQVFEANVFGSLITSTVACIDQLVDDIQRSAPSGLRDRAKLQGESCHEEARVALDKMVEAVERDLDAVQKQTSRAIAPHVKEQLCDGYEEAMKERGKGAVKRQKVRGILLEK
ncbi:hypothetical protein B0H15DRAFT_790889, partial [Mycena belliarum]